MNRMSLVAIVAMMVGMASVGCPGITAAESIEVPIHVSGRTPMVDVRINGKGPYHFVIDTGSRYSQIDADLAQELDLPSHAATKAIAQESAEEGDAYVTISLLQLGELELRDVEAEQWKSHALSPGGEAPDGILGTAELAEYLLTIDNPAGVVVFAKGSLPKPNGRDIFSYAQVDDAPQVQAVIGAMELPVQIHSAGFGPVLLRTEYIEQLSLREKPGRMGKISIDGVTADILGTRLTETMTIGKLAFERPSVRFSEAFSANQLGSGVLGNFVITLDQANQRVRLYAEESFDEQLAMHAAQVPSLDEGAAGLKAAFNDAKDKTRLIVILSPT